MVTGKTRTGFEFSVSENIGTDYRLIDGYKLAKSSDSTEAAEGISMVVDLVLGKNKQAMFKHLAELNDGYVPTKKLDDEVTDIIAAVKEAKNSSPSQS